MITEHVKHNSDKQGTLEMWVYYNVKIFLVVGLFKLFQYLEGDALYWNSDYSNCNQSGKVRSDYINIVNSSNSIKLEDSKTRVYW